jgi:hypothetical protein
MRILIESETELKNALLHLELNTNIRWVNDLKPLEYRFKASFPMELVLLTGGKLAMTRVASEWSKPLPELMEEISNEFG